MARAALKPHSFTVGSTKFIIKLPDVYDNSTHTLGSVFGISKLPANFVPDDDDASMTVSEGLKSGKLIRIRLSYRISTDPNKTKSARVVCPTAKVDTGLNAVVDKTYASKNIVSAGIPRRRRLG